MAQPCSCNEILVHLLHRDPLKTVRSPHLTDRPYGTLSFPSLSAPYHGTFFPHFLDGCIFYSKDRVREMNKTEDRDLLSTGSCPQMVTTAGAASG